MRSRKRGREEMEAEKAPPEVTTLTRLRNMWQFANLVQYLYIFGKAIRSEDDIDIEVQTLAAHLKIHLEDRLN